MSGLRRVCALLVMATVCAGQTAMPPAQTIWFCPIVPAAWNNLIGSVDYLDLFSPGAAWTNASSHVQIFKMFTQMIVPSFPGYFPDSDLQQIFAYLNAHHIALAVEYGPLTPTPSPGCGEGVEGFAGESALTMATRIKQLGGNLQYIALDEPFSFGSLYGGPNACHWTAQQIAANALQNVAQIRAVFPNVIVGDIEPVPDTTQTADWLNRYTAWMDAWTAAAGTPFAFFHFDVFWAVNWKPAVESVRQALAQRGIPFGMIYNGFVTDLTDGAWMADAESHYVEWEAQGGTIPSHVIFESWYPYPQHVLPETDPTALTYLIDSYFRQRTALTMNIDASQASGRLTDSGGQPVGGAAIAITAQTASGPGTVSKYLMTGTVPAGVTQAVIQTCVNACGEVGAADLNIYSFQYADAGGQTSLNFANGLNGWSLEDNSTAVVQIASDGSGKSVQVSATAAQQTFVNSTPIAVVPGSNFNLAIQARVSPSSVGSGYFALVFLTATLKEVNRATLGFAPATLSLGMANTASDGAYTIAFAPLNPGSFHLQAAYVGTDAVWPAYASASVGAPTIPMNGVVNAADFQVEPLAPGSWFSVFGQNLGSAAQWTSPDTLALGGAGVTVCGSPAVISYNSGPVAAGGSTSWQLNALTPDAVAGQSSCPLVVTVNGQAAPPVTVSIASGILELFSVTTSAGALPVITHADYSLVGPARAGLVPARAGETVIAWGTGDCTAPTVTAGGAEASVAFSGRVAAGLCQLNLVVPNGLSGEEVLTLSSSPGVYALWVGTE